MTLFVVFYVKLQVVNAFYIKGSMETTSLYYNAVIRFHTRHNKTLYKDEEGYGLKTALAPHLAYNINRNK